MPWGCASTPWGAKQHQDRCPDGQAQGSAANTAGEALHRNAKYGNPPQALLVEEQKMGPSQQELPTSPGQRKPPVVRRQGCEPEEPQGSCQGSRQSRESSENRNCVPRSDGTPGALAAWPWLMPRLHLEGETSGNCRSQPTAPHRPADQMMPAIQAARGQGERQVKPPVILQAPAAAGGNAQAACFPPPSQANPGLPCTASAHIPASNPQRGDLLPCRA